MFLSSCHAIFVAIIAWNSEHTSPKESMDLLTTWSHPVPGLPIRSGSSGNTRKLKFLKIDHELKDFIHHEIAAIPEAMTRQTLQNFGMRLQECIVQKAKHLDDIIFWTRWWQRENKRIDIVFSYSKLKFLIGSMLLLFFFLFLFIFALNLSGHSARPCASSKKKFLCFFLSNTSID